MNEAIREILIETSFTLAEARYKRQGFLDQLNEANHRYSAEAVIDLMLSLAKKVEDGHKDK